MLALSWSCGFGSHLMLRWKTCCVLWCVATGSLGCAFWRSAWKEDELKAKILCSSLLVVGLVACVAPSTSRPTSDPAVVAAERERQMELVVKTNNKRNERLWAAALPILYANVELCGERVAWNFDGSLVDSLYRHDKAFHSAVAGLGVDALPTIVTVVEGSPAHEAGLRAGDVVVAVDGERVPTPSNKKSADRALKLIADQSNKQTYAMTVRRGDGEVTVDVNNRLACEYPVVMLTDDMLNAFADGNNIYVTSGMLRFLESETELQAVLAHELAHNTEGHIKAKRANAGIGALFGLFLDVAAATQGVYTDFASDFARFASMRFSQDFEREADYVGIYMMERSGIDSSEVGDLWRKMAVENAASITFGRSHPTTAERFVNLDTYSKEARQKKLVGEALLPGRE